MMNKTASHITFFVAFILIVSCRSSEVMTIDSEPEVNETEEAAPADTISAEEERLRKELEAFYRDELVRDYQTKANQLTSYFILAQQHFYNGDYTNALININKAATAKQTADVYALRGSIYLGMGNVSEFVANWKLALTMDENVPIPQSSYIIGALKSYGLVDENLRKKDF